MLLWKMYAPEHWSGSCRICRTGSYGPGVAAGGLDRSPLRFPGHSPRLGGGRWISLPETKDVLAVKRQKGLANLQLC